MVESSFIVCRSERVELPKFVTATSKVKLRGAQGKNGDSKTGATVGLVIAFGVLGFMKHGKQAEVKEGTPVKAYVDEDVQVASLGPAPAASK